MSDNKYKEIMGKNYKYPAYLKENEVSIDFLKDFANQMPINKINDYTSELGLLGRASDIKDKVDRGLLKVYSGMSPEKYNAFASSRGGVAGYGDPYKSTGGYHIYRTAADDTSRIMLNPRQAGIYSDLLPHEFLHEIVGHQIGSKNVPSINLNEKLDKHLHGHNPLTKTFPTEDQLMTKYPSEWSTAHKQIYEKNYHPKTTDAEFNHAVGKHWMRNLNPDMVNKIKYQNFPMVQDNYVAQNKPKQAIRSVRGWLQQNVPWIKKGEGWLPDNIYKQGSWFGM